MVFVHCFVSPYSVLLRSFTSLSTVDQVQLMRRRLYDRRYRCLLRVLVVAANCLISANSSLNFTLAIRVALVLRLELELLVRLA